MKTFEEWLKDWLQAQLGISIKAVITPDSVMISTAGDTNMNIFHTDQSYMIVVKDTKKVKAANLATLINMLLLEKLPDENYVQKVNVFAYEGDREDIPSDWGYVSVASIKHNTRDWSE